MHYQGGKWVAAKWIESHLVKLGADCTRYLEPFVGGASVATRMVPHFGDAVLADVRPDLVLCWNALLDGWEPPYHVSEEEYRALRHAPPSALRGFVGYCCSFGGGWFNGYARDAENRSYAASGARSCLRKTATMEPATWAVADYRSWRPGEGWMVYADPPYADTKGHRTSFEYAEFWDVMRAWRAAGAVVVVSEYKAPDDWACVDTLITPATMAGAGQRKQTEGLWV